jgi:cytochrome c biogenesis protein
MSFAGEDQVSKPPMSTSQNPELEIPVEAVPSKSERASNQSMVDRLLKRLSSVPFGITMLMLMILMSMTGMLIMQVNVDGFDKYFASLTPSQRWLYTDPIVQALRKWTGWELRGWNILSLVDIYKSYVFITLLAVVSLNIILASIDHFPGAWRYVRRKKLTASRPYVKHQAFNATLESDETDEEPLRIAAVCRHFGFRPTGTRAASRTTVFAERGAWNRLGAYFVHVGLLTIFLAGFFTWRSSFNGALTLVPGMQSNVLQGVVYDLDRVQAASFSIAPITIECTDIEQTLIRKDGSLDANNTVDWFTRVRVHDAERQQTVDAEIHMNRPFDYRGYRFFQSSYQNVANARSVTLEVRRTGGPGEEVTLRQRETATLSDGTQVRFADFTGNEAEGAEATSYDSPAALVKVLAPGAARAEDVTVRPLAADANASIVLKDFEKVGGSHTLAVQFDPWGAWTFYVGSVMLIAALMAVFFFSHRRLWFVIETDKDGTRRVFVGGHTNRNRPAFDKQFKEVVAALSPATRN